MFFIKRFFIDLGFPQRYSYLSIKKVTNGNTISFISKTIKDERPARIDPRLELVDIENITTSIEVVHHHKLNNICDITFCDDAKVLMMLDSVLRIIINKIFKRVKDFIEKLRHDSISAIISL